MGRGGGSIVENIANMPTKMSITYVQSEQVFLKMNNKLELSCTELSTAQLPIVSGCLLSLLLLELG